MANKKIKGLEVAISADTTGVTAGLEDVTKDSIKASNNLKQVNALLKLDPDNVELVAEQQKLLAESISATSKKLEALKGAQADVNKEFKAGNISEEEYIAFQKELVNTEKRLNDLKNQEKETEKATDELNEKAVISSDAFKNGLAAGAKAAAEAIAAIGAAAVAAVKGVVDLASKTAEYGDGIDKASQKIGISAEAYQEWDFILQHSGTSAGVLQTAVKKLSTQFENAKSVIDGVAIANKDLDAQLASGEITLDQYNQAYDALYDEAYKGIDAFDALGLSMADLENVGSTEELLSLVVRQLQGMEEGTERTTAATALLGKGAMEMGALFNTSAEDTEAMRQQIHDLGGVMSDEAVKDAAAFQDSLQNMNTAIDGIKNSIGAEFMPSITSIMDGVSAVLSGADGGFEMILSGVQEFSGTITSVVDDIKSKLSGIGSSIMDALGSTAPELLRVGTDLVLEIAAGITSALPNVAKMAVDIAVQISDGILSLAPELLDAGLSVITALSSGLSRALPRLLPMAVKAVTTIAKGLSDSLPDIIDSALLLITGLADGLLVALPVLLQRLPAVIDSLVNGLLGSIPEIIQTGIRLLTSLVSALPQIIQTIVAVLPQIVSSIADAVMENTPLIVSAGFDLITALLDDLPEIISQVVTAVPLIVAAVGQALTEKLPEMSEYGFTLFTQLVERGGEIMEKIGGLIPEIVTKIKDAFMEKYSEIQQMGMDIFDNIAKGIQAVIGDAWTWGSDLISNFVSGITDNIDSIVTAATEAATAIWDYLHFSEPEKGPLSDFSSFAPDMMRTFADGIKDNEDVITAQFNRALSGIRMPELAANINSSPVGSGSPVINVSVSVGSIAGDYDVYRMTDQMVMQMSAGLAQLQSRQAALVGR